MKTLRVRYHYVVIAYTKSKTYMEFDMEVTDEEYANFIDEKKGKRQFKKFLERQKIEETRGSLVKQSFSMIDMETKTFYSAYPKKPWWA